MEISILYEVSLLIVKFFFELILIIIFNKIYNLSWKPINFLKKFNTFEQEERLEEALLPEHDVPLP
jgi:hypothetical protein